MRDCDRLLDAARSPACHAQNIFCQWLTNHDQRAADNDSFLQTDGPSFTRANSTVPQNMLQLETALRLSKPSSA